MAYREYASGQNMKGCKQFTKKVFCLNPTKCSARLRDPNLFCNAPGTPSKIAPILLMSSKILNKKMIFANLIQRKLSTNGSIFGLI